MHSTQLSEFSRSIAALRRFVRGRAPVERCEFCAAGLPAEHQHLLQPSTRKLACACTACVVLFTNQAEASYRRVPERIRFLPDFRLSDALWESLMIPINMAFFFYSTPAGRVIAYYPSPAGPTESLLGLETWDKIVQQNPILADMEPDVEALLINRVGRAHEYYLLPIDQCYKLVGLIRAHWRGLSGGTEVWKEIERFFAELKGKSEVRISKSETDSNDQNTKFRTGAPPRLGHSGFGF